MPKLDPAPFPPEVPPASPDFLAESPLPYGEKDWYIVVGDSPRFVAIQALATRYGRVFLDGIGKRGNVIRGGFDISVSEMDGLCAAWASMRGRAVVESSPALACPNCGLHMEEVLPAPSATGIGALDDFLESANIPQE